MPLPKFDMLPKVLNVDTAIVSRVEWSDVTKYVNNLEHAIDDLKEQLKIAISNFEEIKIEHVRLKNNLASTAKIVEELYENQNS